MLAIKPGSGLLLLLSLGINQVQASEWYVEPSANVRTEFDDNIRLLPNNTADAYGFIAGLTANSGIRSEVYNVGIKTGVDVYEYWGQSNLDRQNFNFGLNSEYLWTEKHRLGLEIDYVRDTSLTSELLTTGNLGNQVGRQSLTVAPNWTYALSAAQSLKAGYSHQDVSYDKNSTNYLSSYLIDSVDLTYSHQWNPAWQYFATLGAYRYDLVDAPTTIDNFSANVGADYLYSETLSFNFMLGARETESQFGNAITPEQQALYNFLNIPSATKSSSLGSLFSVGMKKQFEVANLNLSYARNTSPTGGGVVLETDSFNGNYEHKLTEQLRAQLRTEISLNSSTSSATSTYNRDYYGVEPKLIWNFNRQADVVLGYRYRTQNYTATNVSASGNTFYLYVNYAWDKILGNPF